MRSAREVHGDTMRERRLAGLDGATHDTPGSFHEGGTPWQSNAALFCRRQRTVRHLLHVRRGVYAQQVDGVGAWWIVQVCRLNPSVFPHTVPQQRILGHRKPMPLGKGNRVRRR
jgi:hypothetical protein